MMIQSKLWFGNHLGRGGYQSEMEPGYAEEIVTPADSPQA